MDSLDKLLEQSETQLPREVSLKQPVMAKIKARQQRAKLINRSLFTCLGLLVLVAVGAAAAGNFGKVIFLGSHKLSSVPAHPLLYAKALLEAAPWPAIAVGIIFTVVILMLKQLRPALAAHSARMAMTLAGALALTATASAATLATVGSAPGAAQQELVRVVNGVGYQQTTVGGQTYEFDSGLTDNQVRAQIENVKFRQLDTDLQVAHGSADGGTLSCLCKVAEVNGATIRLKYTYTGEGALPPNPEYLTLTDKTLLLVGATKAPKLELQPDDLVIVGPAADLKSIAYISKLDLSLDDYLWHGHFSGISNAHRSDGKCYNNEADLCPNISNPITALDVANADPVPPGTEIREVYGTILAIDGSTLKLKNGSGTVWTFNLGKYMESFDAKPGDGLRVEFWQPTNDLGNHNVDDESIDIFNMNLTKDKAALLIRDGKLNLNPKRPIRSIQLVVGRN